MALSATILKVELNISDMDRHYYQTHSLTVAMHPSENDTRVMLRLVAFAMFADESLSFTKGLSTDDEPELWQKNLIDDIDLWIDFGQPDEKRIKRACQKSAQVAVFSYGDNATNTWWTANHNKLEQFRNLNVIKIGTEQYQSLAAFSKRNIHLNISIQDGELMLSDEENTLTLNPEFLLSASKSTR